MRNFIYFKDEPGALLLIEEENDEILHPDLLQRCIAAFEDILFSTANFIDS